MTKTCKITEAQAKVLADAIRDYAQAQTDFENWFMTSYFTNGFDEKYDSFEDAVEKNYGFLARRDRPNDIEGYYKEHLDFCRKYYDKYRVGIVDTHTSSNTLRALEKKGLIEILHDGKRDRDWIRLLYV